MRSQTAGYSIEMKVAKPKKVTVKSAKKQADVLLAAIDPGTDCGCGQKTWCHGYRKGQAA
jgi:hypothetical protein